MAAIFKMGLAVANSDGNVANEELAAIALHLAEFGVTDCEPVARAASEMDAAESIRVISNMTTEQKKYVCGFLAAVVVADGKIQESEVKVWQLVSTLCKLPTMSMADALDFWAKN